MSELVCSAIKDCFKKREEYNIKKTLKTEGEVFRMCDVKKYSDIYAEISKLDPDDTMQLVLESESEEEKEFYEMIGDYLLQKKQKESIARNVF